MLTQRLFRALRPVGIHFSFSLVVAVLIGILVFSIWFPYPYRSMAGGKNLFFLICSVDVICGPLLTLVLFDAKKSRRELILDFSVIGLIQILALVYGLWTLFLSRPLYLVHEFDRFKIISAADVAKEELAALPKDLKVGLTDAPKLVSIREVNREERNAVLFESVQGGRDYGERPIFYKAYDGDGAYAQSISIRKYFGIPGNKENFDKNRKNIGFVLNGTEKYLPVVSREDWIAVLAPGGKILGFIRGDGF